MFSTANCIEYLLCVSPLSTLLWMTQKPCNQGQLSPLSYRYKNQGLKVLGSLLTVQACEWSARQPGSEALLLPNQIWADIALLFFPSLFLSRHREQQEMVSSLSCTNSCRPLCEDRSQRQWP